MGYAAMLNYDVTATINPRRGRGLISTALKSNPHTNALRSGHLLILPYDISFQFVNIGKYALCLINKSTVSL